MLQCCHLFIGRVIWFSWSVIWCCPGCRLLLDLPTRLIQNHQWWALTFSSGSLSPSHSSHFPTKMSSVDCIPSLISRSTCPLDLLWTTFLAGFSLADVQESSASADAIMELLQVIPWFSRFSLRSEAWIVVFDLWATLLSSGILLIPRRLVFGNAKVKFLAVTTSLVGKFPSGSAFLCSLINNLGDGVAPDLMVCFTVRIFLLCLRGFLVLLCHAATLVMLVLRLWLISLLMLLCKNILGQVAFHPVVAIGFWHFFVNSWFSQLGPLLGCHGLSVFVVGSWFCGICCCVLWLQSCQVLVQGVPLQVAGGIFQFHLLQRLKDLSLIEAPNTVLTTDPLWPDVLDAFSIGNSESVSVMFWCRLMIWS